MYYKIYYVYCIESCIAAFVVFVLVRYQGHYILKIANLVEQIAYGN